MSGTEVVSEVTLGARTTVPECTGECCRSFPVAIGSLTIEEFRQKAGSFQDGQYITDMLIPLPQLTEFGSLLFTCSHWDPESKRCMDYENRPRMCRNYPYEGRCQQCGGKVVAVEGKS